MAINLRQGNLPAGWKVCILPEFTHIVMGQSPSSSTYNHDRNGLPFYQGKTEFGDIYPSINKYCSKPNKIAKEGATLLSVRAPVGPTNLTNQECCIGRGLAAVHPLAGIDPKFILFLFRNIEPDISGKGTGSTFKAITKSFVEELMFALPPLNEQHRIVAKIEELFSELDKGVESLKTAREQLKLYRQSLLKHAFAGKLTEQWRKDNADKLETADELLTRIQQERESRFQQQLEEWEQAVECWAVEGKVGKKPRKPKKLYDSDRLENSELSKLPNLPDCWSYHRLGEYIQGIDAGKSFKCDEREPNINEVGVAKVSAVSWGEYDEAESKTCVDKEKINPTYFIRDFDFIISRANTIELVGACVIVRKIKKTIMLSDKTLRIHFEKINKKFVLYFLRSWTGRQEIMSRSTGNQESMRNIGQDRIKSICVPVCSMVEMDQILLIVEEQMSIVDEQERIINYSLQQSQALRQSILKKAFSGQLVPQDPNDEPASELLKRIAAEKATKPKTSQRTKKS